MGRITSNVGLITGLPITDTVDQLMAVAGQPRDTLASRTQGLQSQQFALNTLGTRLASFQFSVNKLDSLDVYNARQTTSSNEDVLTASVPTGVTPPIGEFLIQPVRVASTQQLISSQFESLESDFGTGTFSFQFGGFVDKGVSLDSLNGGAGVQRGKIKITDRSGEDAVVDLSFAQSIDDVVDAINADTTIDVTASVSGDALTLTDSSGGGGNLTVQEVAGGTTAANLGLGGIEIAADTITGNDIFTLYDNAKLTSLNDNNGVRLSAEGANDLEITLTDGSATLNIDLGTATTLGEVVDLINAASPGDVSAAIAADGNRLEITDLTGGGGAFVIESSEGSSAAEDLGIVNNAVGATVSGERLVSGLAGTLLSTLNAGSGFDTLGTISITDRDGTVDNSIDLSTAETLSDVVDAINNSTADVTASVNSARNGISIVDNTGGVGNLTIANADGSTSVESLGIQVDDAVDSVNSGTLNRQTLSEATLLSSLNGGEGVKLGDIRVTDSDGVASAADLNGAGNEAVTVGDVIDAINSLAASVTARINDTGDGIVVVDEAGGVGSLGISDISGNIAQSLRLTGGSETIDINGTDTQVIDGTAVQTIDVSNLTSTGESVLLSDLNGGAGITRGTFTIADSNGGNVIAINLNGSEAGVSTVGDLVDAINQKASDFNVGVTASINEAGTGIKLTDNAGGSGDLTVTAINESSVVEDLKLDGKVSTSGNVQTINGAGTFAAGTSAQSGLDALAARINDLNAGVTASTVFDGVGYRLSIVADKSGAANELLIDNGETTFSFTEIAKAEDALLAYGNVTVPGGSVLISSADNKFEGVIGGVDVTVKAASDTPIVVSVASSDTKLVDTVQDLVDAYNAVRDDLDTFTDFNADDLSTGLLFGTNEALQVDTRLSQVLTQRFFGVGDFQSLEEVGLAVNSEGKLELDSAKLREAFSDDPSSIRELFTNAESGVVAKLTTEVERLAGDDSSLLDRRNDTLQLTIDSNNLRLEDFDASLERQRERLLLEFFQLEQIISNLQQGQQALASLQPIAPL
ncbi:flagellar filament capping protein FliD [Adhaeretor mobilis]|uniref:Filament cap protein n=1 Tax=Adhaeretor mobilis TaxID=1930276 RepID=A0A517MTW8_9BACT|nr:flagellar filament capping protein FliD [Adhaeretor mobilis]QDS98326.1 Flagellar hook-associated protein 2 [Adhaeretor mobilis]